MFKAIVISVFIVFVNGAALEKSWYHAATPVKHELIEPIHEAEHLVEKTVENSVVSHGDITKPQETVTTIHSEENVVTEQKPHENQHFHLPAFLQQILPATFVHALEQLALKIPGFRSELIPETIQYAYPLGYPYAYPPLVGFYPVYPQNLAPLYVPPRYIN